MLAWPYEGARPRLAWVLHRYDGRFYIEVRSWVRTTPAEELEMLERGRRLGYF